MSGDAGLQRPPALLVASSWQALTRRLSLPVVLFLAAALVRLASFAVFYTASLLSGHGGHVDYSDPVVYDHWAWLVAQGLRLGAWINITPSYLAGTYDVGFEYWVGFWYALVGHHPEVPRVVDALLASVVPPAVYLAGRATSLGEQVARRAAWLLALWPLTIYWSGYDLIKDPVTWFLIAVGMLALVQRDRVRFVGLGVLVTVVMVLVRSYVGAGFFILLPISAALRRDWKGVVAVTAALVTSQLLLAGFAIHPAVWSPAPYTGNGQALVLQPGSKSSQGSVDELIRRFFHAGGQSTAKVEGGGSDVSSILREGPGPIAARFIVGTSVTVLGPRLSIHDIVHPTIDSGMYPGLLVWLPLIPFTFLGLWRGVRLRDPYVLTFVFLAGGLWLGLSFFYAGVFRQREMAFPPTLLFTALGLSRPWPKRWPLIYGIAISLGLGLLALREVGAF